jgi:porphobilinogen synthase
MLLCGGWDPASQYPDSPMPHPLERPRRLRRTSALRRLARETRLAPADLVLPVFVSEGIERPEPIAALPGHRHETPDSAASVVEEAVSAGCVAALVFGLPERKDAEGSAAWAEDGGVQRAIRSLRRRFDGGCAVIADCCLCEYTDHGHCGVLSEGGGVDNDATLERYARIAVSQAAAGADVIAPSGMMDGQVGAIRQALDDAGFPDTAILGYSAKYASVMYGPFREAAACAPQDGDRRGYQMDPANQREAVREALLDIEEGADMVMVKPALTYLDVVARVRDITNVPLAAYCVSGEYAMLHHAAAAGAFDERTAVLEALTGVRRAGADIVITYHAREAARWLQEEGAAR